MSLDIYVKAEVCPCCGRHDEDFNVNITHNLIEMAKAVELYLPLWCMSESGITKAAQLIEPLTLGILELESCPLEYKVHNPENGWGSYESFLEACKTLLEYCKANPESLVEVCR